MAHPLLLSIDCGKSPSSGVESNARVVTLKVSAALHTHFAHFGSHSERLEHRNGYVVQRSKAGDKGGGEEKILQQWAVKREGISRGEPLDQFENKWRH